MIDLMAWNADATRMPYRMHSEYLRSLFLDNDLAEGRFLVDGRPVSLTDIRVPVFAVGTERDHVAPWRSTYKVNLQLESDVTYLLTTGGHNAGIVSEPGHPGRTYQIAHRPAAGHYVDPETWAAATPASPSRRWFSLARTRSVSPSPENHRPLLSKSKWTRACKPPPKICANSLI
jgi:polyhydroxyalkanoate synthase